MSIVMTGAYEGAGFRVGQWTVEPALNQLKKGAKTVIVEPRVIAALACLADHPGEVVGVETLIAEVWHGTIVGDSPVYQCIAKLRRALDDDPHHPAYIETIPKKGYRLIAEVRDKTPPATMPVTLVPRSRAAQIAFSSVMLIVTSMFFFLSTSDVARTRIDLHVDEGRYGSIAILPFTDMSESQDQEYLGDGIADELIHVFSSTTSMQVIARTSSFSFKDKETDIQTIGDRLGADVILEGSVKRDGDRLRVNTRLFEAGSAREIWSKSYEQPIENVLVIQGEIAAGVMATLDIQPWMPDLESPDVHVVSGAAWTEFLLGQQQVRMRRLDSMNLGIHHFEKALDIDAYFARAYAALSFAYFLASDHRYGDIPNDEAIRLAEKHALKSIEINEQLGEGWRALAAVRSVQGDDEGFRLAAERAYLLSPNSPSILAQYSSVLMDDGRDEKALQVYEKAVRLDPLSSILRFNFAGLLTNIGRVDDAARHGRLAIEADPGFHIPYATFARLLFNQGALEDAAEWYTKGATVEGLTARYAPASSWRMVEIYYLLGEFELAEEWINNAHTAGKPDWWLELHRLQMQLIRDDYSGILTRIDDWMRVVPDDDLCCFYHLMINTMSDARAFAGLLALLAGDESKAMMYLQAAKEMSLEKQRDGDIDNLIRHNKLLGWGYMPSVSYAYLLMNSGNVAEAKSLLKKSLSFVDRIVSEKGSESLPGVIGKTSPGVFYARASVHALLGNRDRAIDDLRLAADKGWFRSWYAKRDPAFASLRYDPEFLEIVGGIDARLAQTRDKIRQDKANGEFKVDLDALYVRE